MVEWKPFPLLDQVPLSASEKILKFSWNRDKLWLLHLPVMNIDISMIEDHLKIPLWAHEGKPFSVSPLAVIREPEAFPEQFNRTLLADLNFPIHVLRKHKRWIILDGVHRTLKAFILGNTTIVAKVLVVQHLDLIAERG